MNLLSSINNQIKYNLNNINIILPNEITFTNFSNITSNLANEPVTNTDASAIAYGPTTPSDTKLATTNDGNIIYFGRTIDPSNVTANNRAIIIQSSNYGMSFSINTLFTGSSSAQSCCMSSDGIYRFFSVADTGLYRSNNSGSSYLFDNSSANFPSGLRIRNISCSKNGKYVVIGVASNATFPGSFVLLSCNYGVNFSNILNGSNITALVNNAVWVSDDGLKVLIGTQNVGIYYTSNAHTNDVPNTSITYTLLHSVASGLCSSISVSSDQKYILSTFNNATNNVFLSTNGLNTSTTFTNITTSIPTGTAIINVPDMDDTGKTMILTRDNMLCYSTNYGVSWNKYTFTIFGASTGAIVGSCITKDNTTSYVILRNTNSFTNTSRYALFKIT